MTAAELAQRLQANRSGTGWMARCPAHEDQTPSLSIAHGLNGGTVVKCFAGCTAEAVMGALGLKVKDLMPEITEHRKSERNHGGDLGMIIDEYLYTDAQGMPLFKVNRYDSKRFRQLRYQHGEYHWGLGNLKTVLYRLPELITGVKEGRVIYIAEGEKDVNRLVKEGLVATCNPMGAGKWRKHYNEDLRGAKVIVIADKDEPGRDHATEVANSLRDVADSVRVIECPDKNGKFVKDSFDYFEAGGNSTELQNVAEAAKPWAKPDEEGSSWAGLVEDGAAMQKRVLPPLVQVVEGIVAERAKLVICSGSKSFKTWVTIDLALSISQGSTFLDLRTCRKRVLYVNLELKADTFARRLQAVAQAKGIELDEAWFRHLPLRGKLGGVSIHAAITRLIELCKRWGVEVVVLDPCYKLNTEGDENSSRDQTLFFNEVDRLTTDGNSTVILNDHSGKGNQSEKDPLDVIRGSSAKGGDLDAAFVIRKHEVQDCFRVDLVHRELPPVAPFVMGWEYPLMSLRGDLNPDQMKKAKGGRTRAHDPLRVLAAIQSRTENNPVSISGWAELAKVNRNTLQPYVSELRMKGFIATAGEGNNARQYITEKGLRAINGA